MLVVDDNADGAESLALLFETLGSDAKTAFDGEHALAVARDFRPTVMLLDVGLPKMDGLEVCRRLREEPWGRHVFIVAMTGWGQERARQKTRDAGFDAHLLKPIDGPALLRMLENRAPAR